MVYYQEARKNRRTWNLVYTCFYYFCGQTSFFFLIIFFPFYIFFVNFLRFFFKFVKKKNLFCFHFGKWLLNNMRIMTIIDDITIVFLSFRAPSLTYSRGSTGCRRCPASPGACRVGHRATAVSETAARLSPAAYCRIAIH